ncbi:hypothetical protein [Candidatus Nitrosocosmicus hydrocola]|uniref:hypothetical protein n=1 Tax=Candidatus Nitrosocosmicus hydrocola TaxID=1826872 RepID=UPI000AC345FD|nr:hypothetical protein [Candidatus Nitrosocosmicus hydrocola]
MLKSIDTKLTAVLVVAVFAVLMTLGPAASNFQSVFATNGVDSEQCRDDEDYYEDNEEACDKDLRLHFGEDYDGDFGSKSIDDDDDDEDNNNNNNGNRSNQGIGQSQSSSQNSQCVSGGDTNDSCNNISLQNQENSGNNAAAQNGGDDDDDDGNRSNQGIGQSQSSRQNSQCVSGGDTNDSCNNISLQNQENSGNNAAAQNGGDDDDDDGNRSNQGIGQSQSSRQNSQCVAGGSLGNSCNNISLQNQENSGNNAAAQNGGDDDDDDGNRSNQGIGQNQDNEQNAQCVSGEDAIVSCDNVSFQNQVNSGKNALAQD